MGTAPALMRSQRADDFAECTREVALRSHLR